MKLYHKAKLLPLPILVCSVIKFIMSFAILQLLAGMCAHMEGGVLGAALVYDNVTYIRRRQSNCA